VRGGVESGYGVVNAPSYGRRFGVKRVHLRLAVKG
jgi:hypothetical protein